MRYFKYITSLLLSGLFLFSLPFVQAEEDTVTIPYTITGIDENAIEGKLSGTVTFKKSEKSKDILLKIKEDLKLKPGQKLNFEFGKLPDSVTLGDDQSISITVVDDTTSKNTPPTGADKTITVKAGDKYEFKSEDFGSQFSVILEKSPNNGKVCGEIIGTVSSSTCGDGIKGQPILASKITYQSDKDYVGKETFQYKLSESASETYTVTINIESASSATVSKDVKQQIPNQTVFVGDSLDLYIMLKDSDGNDISSLYGYSATGLPSSRNLNLNLYNISGTLNDKDVGEHTVTVSVNDTKGRPVSSTFTLTVKAKSETATDKTAQDVKQQIPDQTVFVGDSLDLYIMLKDSDGNDISSLYGYSATGLPSSRNLNLNLYNISGTLSDKDVGEHTVTVSVNDTKGRPVSSTFKLTVKPKTEIIATTKPKQIEFNIEKVEQAEGTAGEAEYVFTVRLVDGPAKEDVKARYSVTGSGTNSASANDFVGNAFPQGELTIPAGDEGAPITIKVKGDNVKEESEQFTITLSNPSSGVSIVENGKSSIGVIQDGNGKTSTDSSTFAADINECPACMNGGQCTDGRTCTCPAGFTGEICELSATGSQETGTATSIPKKKFKLTKRSFLLMDSRLKSGSSPTQVESLTTSVTTITNPTTSFTPIALTASGAPLANGDANPLTNIEVRIDDAGTNTISAALDPGAGGSANGAFILTANGFDQGIIGPSGGPFTPISTSPAPPFAEGSVDIIMQRTTDSVFFKITINWTDDNGATGESTLNSLSGFNCGTSQADCP